MHIGDLLIPESLEYVPVFTDAEHRLLPKHGEHRLPIEDALLLYCIVAPRYLLANVGVVFLGF